MFTNAILLNSIIVLLYELGGLRSLSSSIYHLIFIVENISWEGLDPVWILRVVM